MSELSQYSTFRVDGDVFGVEVARVREVFRAVPVTPVPLAHPCVEGLINLRGQIVTALDTRRCFDYPPRPDGVEPINVLIRDGDHAVSLLVDEIGDVVTVPRDRLEIPPETVPTAVRAVTRAVCQVADGLLLVVDTDAVLESAAQS